MGAPSIRMGVVRNFQEKTLKRSFNRISRESSGVALQHHADENIPEHFKDSAPRKYNYAPRKSWISISGLNLPADTKASLRKKYKSSHMPYTAAKRYFRLKPMQWSGETERTVMNPANQKITYTSTKGGKLTIKTPSYVTSRLKTRKVSYLDAVRGKQFKPTQHQREALKRASELEATTPREISGLQQIWRREFLDIYRNKSHPKHHLVELRQRANRRRSR